MHISSTNFYFVARNMHLFNYCIIIILIMIDYTSFLQIITSWCPAISQSMNATASFQPQCGYNDSQTSVNPSSINLASAVEMKVHL